MSHIQLSRARRPHAGLGLPVQGAQSAGRSDGRRLAELKTAQPAVKDRIARPASRAERATTPHAFA